MLGTLLVALVAVAAPATPCYSLDGSMSVRGPTLVGDVDGDGAPDTVRTEAEWVDAQTCRAGLVVETAHGVYRAAVLSDGPLAAPPGLAGLVRLDRRPGLEVALVTWEGASTTFIQVFTLKRRQLALLDGPLLGHGGSVTHRSGVDCARRRGTILVSSQAALGPRGARYRVVRRFFALVSGSLVERPALTERYRLREPGLGRFREFADQVHAFPSCTEAT